MTFLTRLFRPSPVAPDLESLQAECNAAQDAHNAALSAGDTRLQHYTRQRLTAAKHALLAGELAG